MFFVIVAPSSSPAQHLKKFIHGARLRNTGKITTPVFCIDFAVNSLWHWLDDRMQWYRFLCGRTLCFADKVVGLENLFIDKLLMDVQN